MTLGPLFRREFRGHRREQHGFQKRSTEAILLGVTALAIYGVVFELPHGIGLRVEHSPAAKRLWLGRIVFLTTFGLEGFLLTARVADAAAGAVAEERDEDTFAWLILTRLTPVEIVATKAVARGLAAAGLSLIGLPLLVGSAELAGLGDELPLALVVLASTATFAAALATLAGVRARPVAAAKARAGFAVVGWLVVPPVLTLIPAWAGSIGGDLLAGVKVAAGLVAPMSPISLVTDLGWLFRPTADPLEFRVAVLVALQTAAGLIALGLAARRLRPTDRPAGRGDPARGGRARCGNDPIFWREFQLPATSTARLSLLAGLSHLVLLGRILVLNVLAFLGTALALAIPLSILGATIYFGSAALQEAWRTSQLSAGGVAHADRDRFNGMIRYYSAVALFFPILGVPATVIGRFTAERDRKTWDDFLMTPLDAAEILWSKARVAWYSFRRLAAGTAAIWAVGIASGALMPLAVMLAAGDLALMLWAAITLGLTWGIRPLASSSISNRALLAAIVLSACHAPVLGVLSLSPHEFASARAGSPWFLPGLALGGLTVALSTASVAWWAWRRSVTRFDRWVGRPHRAGSLDRD